MVKMYSSVESNAAIYKLMSQPYFQFLSYTKLFAKYQFIFYLSFL